MSRATYSLSKLDPLLDFIKDHGAHNASITLFSDGSGFLSVEASAKTSIHIIKESLCHEANNDRGVNILYDKKNVEVQFESEIIVKPVWEPPRQLSLEETE